MEQHAVSVAADTRLWSGTPEESSTLLPPPVGNVRTSTVRRRGAGERAHMTSGWRIRSIVFVVGVTAAAALVYGSRQDVRPRHSADPTLEGNSPTGETVWVLANGLRLKTRVYRSTQTSDHPALVIVLHGDSPFQAPSYQYVFARMAAAQNPDMVAAAILRPGYADDTGDVSDGIRGRTTGDNYTPQVVDAIAAAIRALKVQYAASRVILVGHSGGAAIAADLIGRARGLADGALLVSCPCDLPAFRRHMGWKQMNPLWLLPVSSLPPLDLISTVPPTTRVRMLVGTKDDVAPPTMTEAYAAALRARDIDVTAVEVPEAPHDILLTPVSFEQLNALAKTVSLSAGAGVR